MATLTITATHDYRGDSLSNITDIVFNTSEPTTATFTSEQLGLGRIPDALQVHIHITGDGQSNNLVLVGAVVELIGLTFSSWSGPTDSITLQGTGTGDFLFGSAESDTFPADASGPDAFIGREGGDTFIFSAPPINGTQVSGGDGRDSLLIAGLGNFDFRGLSLSGLEEIVLLANAAGSSAQFKASQIEGVVSIVGGTGSNALVVEGDTVNLYNKVFSVWTDVEDTIAINGTSGPDTLTGSNRDDTVDGGNGADALFGAPGRDLLLAGGGDDVLDGGADIDTVLFAGARNQFDVRTSLVEGLLRTEVTHVGGAASDGHDILKSVENLQFSDHAFALAGAQLNHQSNVAGSRFDDVVFENAASGQVFFARLVAGAFQDWGVVTNALPASTHAIATGNVDPGLPGGAETFVQQSTTGAISYVSLDGGASTTTLVSSVLTADWKLRAVADVNGDASVNVIIQNQASGTIYFGDLPGGAFFGWHPVTASLTADWVAAGAGDVNRDGFADVIVQQQSTGTTYFANMANGTFSGWGVVAASVTADWQVKAVADLNGDGFADVVFQNLSGGPGVAAGTTYFADMANGAFAGWGVVTASVTGDWAAKGTADVDNDGFADVLFQNATSGTTYYAGMGASGFEAWGVVASGMGHAWQIL